jgi:thiol:disulfide interchange protein
MPVVWKEDVDQALAEAKKSRKPVLLDFTAAPM